MALKQKTRVLIFIAITILIVILMFIFIPKEENDVHAVREVWSNKDYFLNKEIKIKGFADYDEDRITCTTGMPPSCGVSLGLKIDKNNLLRLTNLPEEKDIGCKGTKPVCYPPAKEEYILNGTLKKQEPYGKYYFEVNSFERVFYIQ